MVRNSAGACARRRLVVLPVVGGLVAALLAGAVPAPPAVAAPGSVPAAPVDPATRVEAVEQAEAQGEPVEVTAETTPTERLLANPDGTMTQELSSTPVRVQQGDRWVPVDRTLVRNADGSLRPRAVPFATTFGAGGREPFVRFGTARSELALSWPSPLPEPVVDGPTATYPEVLPGVDLTVSADVDSFSQALVVKTAEAARQPALAKLSFGLSLRGGMIREVPDGGFEVVDGIGAAVMTSPTPIMWDSGTPAAAVPAALSRRSTARTAVATVPEDVAADPEAPGEASRSAEVDLQVTPTSMTLVPDAKMLTSPETTFPLYIDPKTYGPKANSRNMVDKAFPGQEYHNWGGDDQGVGYQDYEPWSTKRLFYQFPISRLAKKDIMSAELAVTETWSGGCTAQPVEAHLTPPTAGARTNWNNQPDSVMWLDSISAAYGNSKCEKGTNAGPDNKRLEFNVVEGVRARTSRKRTTATFRLKANDESDPKEWKRFAKDAVLSVTYNSTPRTPTKVEGPGGSCQKVAADAPRVAAGPARFDAWLTDPDKGEQLTGYMTYTTPSGKKEKLDDGPKRGGNFNWEPRARLSENGRWQYEVHSNDGRAMSPKVGPCYFVLDSAAPPAPVILLDGKPQERDDETREVLPPTVELGRPLAFSFGPGSGADTSAYRYSVNQDTPTSGRMDSAPGASVAKSLSMPASGPNVVRVWAFDAAGNQSAPAQFELRSGGFTPARWGLDGTASPAAADPACVPTGIGSAPSAISWSAGVTVDGGHVSGLASPDRALKFSGTGTATTTGSAPVVNGSVAQNYTVMGWVHVDASVLDETDADEAPPRLVGSAPRVALSIDGATERSFRVGVVAGRDPETAGAARFFASVIGAGAKTGARDWRTVIDEDTPVFSDRWYQVTATVMPGQRVIELTVSTHDIDFNLIEVSTPVSDDWDGEFDPLEPSGALRLGGSRSNSGAVDDPWKGHVDEVYGLRGAQLSSDREQPGPDIDLLIRQIPPFIRDGRTVPSPCA